MQVQVEKTGPCESKVSISIPAEKVDEVFEQVFRKVARSARIPGFRPGKAPKGVIESHYGEQIRGDVENKLIEETLFSAMQAQNLSPVVAPAVKTGDLKKGTEYAYSADIETQPE